MKTDKTAPLNCRICHGDAAVRTIIRQFTHTDYGHVACKRCGITFDDNVNHTIDLQLKTSDIRNIADEGEYRRLFIETSRIADGDGDIYANFNWDNNDQVKQGVASHVVDAVSRQRELASLNDILDLGCGNGFTSVELANHFPSARLVAVDPSPEVVKVDGIKGISAIQGTIDSLHFPSETFDAVFIIGNLMLHNNPQRTLEEVYRVLRPGGILILDFKNIDSTLRRAVKAAAVVGLQKAVPAKMLDRAFINMRFGFNRKFMSGMCSGIGFTLKETYSKPPRLLEFKNKSAHQAGLKGAIWRLTHLVDRALDQQAWVQMTWVKAGVKAGIKAGVNTRD